MTERTPLLYRGGGAAGGAGVGSNSRTTSSTISSITDHHHPHHQYREDGTTTTTTTTAAFEDYSDLGGGDSASKRDRRSVAGRIWGNLSQRILRRSRSVGGIINNVRGGGGGGVASFLPRQSTSASAPPACGAAIGATQIAMNDEHMYEDTYNDEPWNCSCGTSENDGIWLNSYDRVGTLMAALVWILYLYSAVTVVLLAQRHRSPVAVSALYCTICALALASHVKTSVTDPGSVPSSAVPVQASMSKLQPMCSTCQTYKPPGSHHCRICNRYAPSPPSLFSFSLNLSVRSHPLLLPSLIDRVDA